jgi:surface polysaccharide O-acyltransferase-like enzyme
VFVLARYGLAKVKKLPKVLQIMSDYSFGVFIIHEGLLLFVVYKYWYTENLRFDNMFWMIPAITIGTYLVSLVITAVLRKIPLVEKVI